MPPLACPGPDLLALLLVLALPACFGCAVVIGGACLSLPIALVRSHQLFVRHAAAWKRRVVEHGSPYRSGIRVAASRSPLLLRALDVAAFTAGYAAPCVVPAGLVAGPGIWIALPAVPLIVHGSLELGRFANALPARRPAGRTRVMGWGVFLAGLGCMALAPVTRPFGGDTSAVVSTVLGFGWFGCALMIAAAALTVALWPLGVRRARRVAPTAAPQAPVSYKPVLWRIALCVCSACAGLASI